MEVSKQMWRKWHRFFLTTHIYMIWQWIAVFLQWICIQAVHISSILQRSNVVCPRISSNIIGLLCVRRRSAGYLWGCLPGLFGFLYVAWLSRSTQKQCCSRSSFARICSPTARGDLRRLPAPPYKYHRFDDEQRCFYKEIIRMQYEHTGSNWFYKEWRCLYNELVSRQYIHHWFYSE